MPAELLYTPATEAEWVHVFEPRPQMDPTKPLAWSLNLLFPSDHTIFKELEAKILAMFPGRQGLKFPFKPHKNKEGITVLKFKASQLQRRDSTFIDPPRVVDAKKQPWSSGPIGNGSIVRVCYFVNPYDKGGNVGAALIPKSLQVLQWVPMSDGTEGFDEDENGYSQSVDDQDGGW